MFGRPWTSPNPSNGSSEKSTIGLNAASVMITTPAITPVTSPVPPIFAIIVAPNANIVTMKNFATMITNRMIPIFRATFLAGGQTEATIPSGR